MESTFNYDTAGLDIIIGPMFAGKTTELIRRLNLYSEMDLKVLYINSTLDNRTMNNFSTHNETLKNTHKIIYVKANTLSEWFETIQQFDIIGIDEAQFFSDLYDSVTKILDKYQKRIIVAGLDGNYRREPFGEIIKLIPLCDSVIKYKPFCHFCKTIKKITPAIFTFRHSTSDDTIDIGGKDKYVPVCRKCYSTYKS